MPDARAGVDAGFRADGAGRYQADVATPALTVAPGATATTTQRFFAGAKEVTVLDGYEKAGIARFDRAIGLGVVRLVREADLLPPRLAVPRGRQLRRRDRAAHLLRPRAALSRRAEAVRLDGEDARPPAQDEGAAGALEGRQAAPPAGDEKLYKSEQANPLAGCLPIFIQMPIFIALYKVLALSIEMRHQPFALWIRDLSAPRSADPVNLFGYLPFQPPGMLHLGMLAILLGVTMWLQMKMNPAAGDPAQQQVMAIMPWMMMLFFAPLAAGLQLYYVANNLLTLAQQRFLYARTPACAIPCRRNERARPKALSPRGRGLGEGESGEAERDASPTHPPFPRASPRKGRGSSRSKPASSSPARSPS